jgi:hypothetical protein
VALGLTQSLTEIFWKESKAQPAPKAEIFSAISKPISRKCRSLDVSQTYGH